MSQATPSSPRILALVPAYNEAGRVGGVVAAVRARLPVLVVDDGSADGTARLAEDAGATVLRQQPNQGKGAALRAGFRWALDAGYDAVITLDADGQHDPAEIPAFIDAFTAQNADLVIGERTFRQMPFPRNLSNTIGRWLFSWALGQPVRDNQSGYRLLSRRMMEATLSSREGGFEFEVEMIVTCVQRGYRLAGVPIRTIYEGEESHIKPIPQTVHFMRVVWATRQAMRRARQREGRRSRWLPLLLLPLIGVIGAALVLARDDAWNDDGEALSLYPTPAAVTFIPPTPLPSA
ncbi:MAG: glycosyltransferase family 2 protein, partial [Chloroflexota bacterium]